MKYKLFDVHNDGSYLNESSIDLRTLMEREELPLIENIPTDGTWSETVSFDGPQEVGSLIFDDNIEKIEWSCRATINENVKRGEPRAKLSVMNQIHWDPRGEGDKIWYNEKVIVLIDETWYVSLDECS